MNKSGGQYGLIAEDIAQFGLHSVDKNDKISEVIRIMDKKGISGVMINDEEENKYYLISHADIIRFINRNTEYIETMIKMDKNPLVTTKCKSIMRGPIQIIPKDESIDSIINLLHINGSKRLYVGDEDGKPIGIITLRDILTFNSDYFQKGTPIMILVFDNSSGIIYDNEYFDETHFGSDLLELFGGSLSAIRNILSEVLESAGDLKIISRDYYDIMLETSEEYNVTAVLIADYQSFDLRNKLKRFLDKYIEKHKKILFSNRNQVSLFEIGKLKKIFL